MVACTITGLKKMPINKPDLVGEFSRGGSNVVQTQFGDKHASGYSLANHTEESKASDRTIKKRRDKQTLSASKQPFTAAKVFCQFYLSSFETDS